MKYVVLSVLLLWPVATLAQGYPALHDVTGVASDDTLNIRAEPRAGADRIGALAHDASDVEVIRESDGWGLVNSGEGSGWASLRYLARQPGGDYALSRHMTCYGTEPFWSLDIVQGASIAFEWAGSGPVSAPVGLLQRSANRNDRFFVTSELTAAVIAVGACTDGMSDREFGLTVDFFLGAERPVQMLSGCCSLARH